MIWRLYKPSDETAVRAIFAKQQLAARLPLPNIDPAVMTCIVGEEDGVVKLALIQRLTIETHLVIDPQEPNGPQKVTDGQKVASGATLAEAERMGKMGFGAPDDVIAFVPCNNQEMHKLMQVMGFVDEVPEFQAMYRPLGQVRK
jgi:hypothetical protein